MAKSNKTPGISKAQQEAAQAVAESYEQGLITLSQYDKILDKILDKTLATKDAIIEQLVKQEELRSVVQGREKLEERSKTLAEKRKTLDEDITDHARDLNEMQADLFKSSTGLFRLTGDQLDAQKKLVADKITELQLLKQSVDGRTSQGKLIRTELDMANELMTALENQERILGTDQHAKMVGAFNDASEKAKELGGAVDTMFDSLPAGGFIAASLGLDDASDKLQNGVNVGFQAMNAHLVQGGTLAGGLTAAMRAFNSVVMMNPLLLVVAAGTALFGVLSEIEGAAQDFNKSTGLDIAQSKQLVKETRTRAMDSKNLLANTEDVLAIQQELIKEMGTAGKLSTETATQVAETAKAYGITSDVAAKGIEAFERQGASAEEAAKIQESLAAKTFKSGISTGQVMEDIAANSEDAMKYIGGGAEELADAAFEAAKMGMNLKQMTNIADGLLDIEKSLNAQFEFQALSGKQINLDKARELALEGDLVGASKEVMKNVGSLAEFNEMNRFEKEKLAEATGMELGELQKTLTLQEKLGDLSEEQAAAAQSLGLSAEQLADMSPEQIKAKMQEAQAAEQMKKSMDDLMMKLKSAFLPVAEAIGSVFTALAPVISFIGEGFSAIGKILGYVLAPVKAIFEGISGVFNMLGPIGTLVKVIGAGLLLWWLYKKWMARQDASAKADMMQKTIMQAQYNAALKQEERVTDEIKDDIDSTLRDERKRERQIKDQTRALKSQGDQIQKNAKAAADTGPKRRGLGGMFGGGGGGMMGGMGGMAMGGGILALAGAGMAMSGGMNMDQFKSSGPVVGVGDLAIDPNGGPVVASPKEGGIYQGTKNDGVSMSPSHGKTGKGGESGGGGNSGGGIDYEKLGAAVAAAIASNPPQVNMDGHQLSKQVSATQSRDKGIR
jgi:hypothetical protein